MPIKVTIWNEGRHEQTDADVRHHYPDRIDGAIATGIRHADFEIRRATLDDPEQGLPDALLNDTDVLLWWGHVAHHEVSDGLIDRIQQRVLQGMGLVILHSGHHSKLFRRLVGTNANLAWRELPEGDLERVWVVNPAHPIAEGLPPLFRDRRLGDVWRAVRHPAAGRFDLHFMVFRRRGVSQRLHVPARTGAHLLFRPGPRDLSDLS